MYDSIKFLFLSLVFWNISFSIKIIGFDTIS